MNRRLTTRMLGAALAAALATSCSSDGDEGSDTTVTTTGTQNSTSEATGTTTRPPTTPDGGGDGSAGSLGDLLALAPDTEATRQQAIYGSLARLREVGGVEPAADVADDVRALQDVAPAAWVVAPPFGQRALLIEPAEVGFDLTAVDASLDAGIVPENVSIFAGRVDAGRVDAALTTYEPWAAELALDERNGVAVYRFGEEGSTAIDMITPARPIGEPVRVAVQDGTVWWARSDATLDAAVDAATAGGPSLADVEGYDEVAAVLDAADTYTAMVVGDPTVTALDPAVIGRLVPPAQIDEILEEARAGLLARYEVVAVGDSLTGDGADRLTIALFHADAAAAEANAAALADALANGRSVVTNESWSELCGRAEVTSDDQVVTATCTPSRPGMAIDLIIQRDPLLAWQ